MVADGLVAVSEVFLMVGLGLGIASVMAFEPLKDTFTCLDTDFSLQSILTQVTHKLISLDEVGLYVVARIF